MGINKEEWLSALRAASLTVEDNADAITVNQFAEMLSLGHTASRNRLLALVESGRAKRVKRRMLGADGRLVVVSAYQLIKDESQGAGDALRAAAGVVAGRDRVAERRGGRGARTAGKGRV